MAGYIDATAQLKSSAYPEDIRCYRNARVTDSKLGSGVSIGDDTTIERCVLGDHVAINRRSYINDSVIGAYSYAGINTTMNFTRLGKYCSLARNVDIGGFDHDYKKVTTMPLFRFQQMKNTAKPATAHDELCEIGNDVWIAAGAQVLHKVKIGDGAIVGGGAVVTKDVPPYAIVAGVPAKIIKYRFDPETISQLLEIRWWDWPEHIVEENISWLTGEDVNQETLEKMRQIAAGIPR